MWLVHSLFENSHHWKEPNRTQHIHRVIKDRSDIFLYFSISIRCTHQLIYSPPIIGRVGESHSPSFIHLEEKKPYSPIHETSPTIAENQLMQSF
jgi:hypothetical protein